jgi:hypothetical protein
MKDTGVGPYLANDTTLVKLAREIAWQIQPLEKILESSKLTVSEWEIIKEHPRFQRYLEAEMVSWNSAANTHERVKVKAAALVEEWLPELYSRMNDQSESLNAKIEAGKLATRIAGMGLDRANLTGETGEKFSVTINLGADQHIKFEKDITPRIIDVEAEPS